MYARRYEPRCTCSSMKRSPAPGRSGPPRYDPPKCARAHQNVTPTQKSHGSGRSTQALGPTPPESHGTQRSAKTHSANGHARLLVSVTHVRAVTAVHRNAVVTIAMPIMSSSGTRVQQRCNLRQHTLGTRLLITPLSPIALRVDFSSVSSRSLTSNLQVPAVARCTSARCQ